MSIIIFIIVLAALIFVHELGHFLAAKWSGIRVDAFAIGFPPKILKWKKGETEYSVGLIPFGGYVKILGEDSVKDPIIAESNKGRMFTDKPKWVQAWVLSAGVIFNIIFAWILISSVYMFGNTVVPVSEFQFFKPDSTKIMIDGVSPDSPASLAGIKYGDLVLSLTVDGTEFAPESVEQFRNVVELAGDKEIEILIYRGELKNFSLHSKVLDGTNRRIVGVSLNKYGSYSFAPHEAIFQGLISTVEYTKQTAVFLWDFIIGAFKRQADLSEVAGPVGIVGLIGEASSMGITYLLTFVALISINLAVINIIPFPALDGGRIFVIIIESIIRRPLHSKAVDIVNLIGFILLMALLITITWNDIGRLIGK